GLGERLRPRGEAAGLVRGERRLRVRHPGGRRQRFAGDRPFPARQAGLLRALLLRHGLDGPVPRDPGAGGGGLRARHPAGGRHGGGRAAGRARLAGAVFRGDRLDPLRADADPGLDPVVHAAGHGGERASGPGPALGGGLGGAVRGPVGERRLHAGADPAGRRVPDRVGRGGDRGRWRRPEVVHGAAVGPGRPRGPAGAPDTDAVAAAPPPGASGAVGAAGGAGPGWYTVLLWALGGLAVLLAPLTPMLWRLRTRAVRLGAHGRSEADAAPHVLAVWDELTDTAWDHGVSPD